MITRKPSKIIDSVVNSSHEEHLNVSKGIRDDAPITNLTTCVKSLNFEASDDGSYILRKPLIKKEDLASITNPVTYPFEFYLSDKEHKVTVFEITEEVDEEEVTNRILQIPGASKIILKFYDNDTVEHKIEFNGNSITVNWLTINSTFNTSDHTIINGVINHRTFLDNYSYTTLVTRRTSKWAWTLVNATHFRAIGAVHDYAKTITNLKRFIKIYESVDETDTFIIEIVHPELNTFTSGLDVGNTEALETNLLLDNPYAIRDLYGYGYISVTKIVPYVLNATEAQEETVEIDTLNEYPIWDLTENDFAPNEAHIPYQHFRMLISTNPNVFNKRYLILKAFLTTAVSNVDYYCCWEESKNGGIDWEVCQEFINKFELTEEDEQTVSDLTAKEFNEMLYKESLTEAQSYIVKKKLYHMSELKTKDYHQDDYIEDRPDVLILENPDLSKLYRFTIYVDSNKQTPDPTVVNHTAIKTPFTELEGDIDSDGYIKYEAINNDGVSNAEIQDECLLLHEGSIALVAPETTGYYDKYYSKISPTLGVGNSVRIYTEDPTVKIKSISYSLAPNRYDTVSDKYYDLGAFVGITKTTLTANDINIPIEYEHYNEDVIDPDYQFGQTSLVTNVFDFTYRLSYETQDDTQFDDRITQISAWPFSGGVAANPNLDILQNLWNGASQTKTILCTDTDTEVYLTNVVNIAYAETTKVVPYSNYPYPIENTENKSLFFHTRDGYMNTTIRFYRGTSLAGELSTSETHGDYIDPNTYQRFSTIIIGIGVETYTNNNTKYFRVFQVQIGYGSSYYKCTIGTQYEGITKIEIGVTGGNMAACGSLVDSFSGTLPIYNFDFDLWLEEPTYFLPENNPAPSRVPTLNTHPDYLYTQFYNRTGIEFEQNNQVSLKLKSISVVFTTSENTPYTSVYMTSISGSYQVPYSNTTELSIDLTSERDKIFAVDSNFYYNENQMQLLVYNDRFVYSSGTNSAVMKLMNSLTLPEEVTKIISWRGYLLLFSPRNIYLAKYNSAIDGYDLKVLSNTVGVSKVDADTITPILNSVYFKSGNKIYKLVPNLYAASDDILNIHQISTGINNLLEEFTSTYTETHNFSYADADTYMIFIPIQVSVSNKFTTCICYDFNKQIWTLQKYPVFLQGIEKFSSLEVYVKDNNHLYYFKDSMSKIMAEARSSEDPDLDTILRTIKYADYLFHTPTEILSHINTWTDVSYINICNDIHFEIDFGQKSSNYTLDKQFLETKLIFATLSSRDMFPVSLDIYTDGVSRELHWDANTDGALWKDTEYKGIANYNSFGVLNTGFNPNGADYNGIFRQLIVKYSGKGKSIRHVISGDAKRLFKFYSMNVRARILPKKH